MEYPNELIRGILNKEYLDDEGKPKTKLFLDDFNKRTQREDGFIETSINWKDDELALDMILKQKKTTGEIQFKAGAVILIRSEIDHISRRLNGALSYERIKDPEYPENTYHGNLLLKNGTSKKARSMIAASIVLLCCHDDVIDNMYQDKING
jgi:hypothetical protein